MEPIVFINMKEDLKKIYETRKRNRKILALSDNFEKVKTIVSQKRQSSPSKEQILENIKERGMKLT